MVMTYPLIEAQDIIETLLIDACKHLGVSTDITLEQPPKELGDFAFPCFSLAPQAKKAPQAIAEQIANAIPSHDIIENIEPKAGYVNFFLSIEYLIHSTLSLIQEMDETYGHLEKNHHSVIIEHTSANPNGPLHVGRARNPIIGDTLVRLYKAAGYNVDSQFYLDDMGKQVALLTWGIHHKTKKTPPKPSVDKADHHMVWYYQQAHDLMKEKPEVEVEVQELIRKSELGDKETLTQMKEAYQPVLEGINESLHRINISIDTYIPESTFVKDRSVETVVQQLQQTKHAATDDGAWYLNLESFGVKGRSTRFYFTRHDGTTLYATRDIAYHLWKATQADTLVNILGEDHKLESKQVQIALKLLQSPTMPQPVFYAFVSLPEGKMSTRRGRVVYLDDLINDCVQRAYEEVKKRRGEELTPQQMQTIAEQVGTGAVRYNIIKVQPEKDIVFKWEDALNFEGNAVPFIQYAHARACSILNKSTERITSQHTPNYQHLSEIDLVKQLAHLPMTIAEAVNSNRPHLLSLYVFETASLFNQFYRDCPVIKEQDKHLRQSRLQLVNSTRIVLRNCLNLLGISAPQEM